MRRRPELEDRPLALKLFTGKHHTKAYPTPEELEDFGRRVCGVSQPSHTLQRIAAAMHSTLERAKGDPRVPEALQQQMAQAWEWVGVWVCGVDGRYWAFCCGDAMTASG